MTTGTREPGVEDVAAYLSARVGFTLTGPRREHLLRQLADAMIAAGVADSRDYCARLEKDQSEFDAVVGRVTVGESYFFREPHQLAVLRSTILPERQRTRGTAGLQLWSAGCAIGQEAYTLGILLEESGLSARSRVLGTDLSREALQVAQTGVYGEWSLRSVSHRQRASYFTSVATGMQIAERIARAVAFRQLNLLDEADPMPHDVDVILCRNVLIYFTADAVQHAASRLCGALAPGGWLVTGSSDPPLQDVAGLQATRTPGGVVYRRLDGPAETAPARARPAPSRPTASLTADVPRAVRTFPLLVDTPVPPAVDTGEEAVRRVRALGGSGDLAGAADTAEQAVATFPFHAELRFLQAVVLLEVGRAAEAATAARATLYLDPNLVVAHLALARAEAARGNGPAARRSLRNATALLRNVPADATVPLSDGERAGRLAAMAAAHDRALSAEGGRR